ncbi:DUF397 domain-containing protein [Kitasatospora herbaricolor]|uniref:DUF397 domain-containing protein n=1 Tax=Kitasatospora herbaricolor TaxID=68217 RepID=UPI0036DCCACB
MTHFPVASELPVSWQKAKASNANDNCVECGDLGVSTAVRDSKNPDGPAHRYPAQVFADFARAVGAGVLVRVDK